MKINIMAKVSGLTVTLKRASSSMTSYKMAFSGSF
jgi:hypothetical protein